MLAIKIPLLHCNYEQRIATGVTEGFRCLSDFSQRNYTFVDVGPSLHLGAFSWCGFVRIVH